MVHLYFLKRGFLGAALSLAALAAHAQATYLAPDSVRGPVPPAVLLKVGLRATHISYSANSQAWSLVVPLSLGAEYRLAPRFGFYGQVEADLQTGRTTIARRRGPSQAAVAVPSAALGVGLRYYYNQPRHGEPLRNTNLYGSYLAVEGNIERNTVVGRYVSLSRRQATTGLTPGLYAYWGTQHRLRGALLYDASAGLGFQAPTYYNFESIAPAHYNIAVQVNLRLYWSHGFYAH
ncbi:hypothetical protein [Hymenobacter sp. BT559]|uniref:hypothetical protein n=1 Tax=Hymenobacter sp. BT559 TaxID=2795729 RepID=UPI0018EE03B8|nr:hypothetical protein [Hymenobacter sp. BT559]MBJ6143281.1 hypothetical protein [Hymenobacter sp. BT559]